jgi:cytosine/adenosine deaminase-related metal-dependent hydrolase
VSDKTLRQAVALTKIHRSGIHIHVAEDGYDQERSIREHGKRVVGRLSEAGIMNNPKSILVHCLHLDDSERELISSSPAWVAQNSESNLNNNVGHFKSAGLGDNIMLGTDGMHSDMLRSAKAAFLDGQQADTITVESAYRRFRNVHRYLRENSFEGDGDNNLVILDYDTPTPVNRENFLSHFIYGLTAEHVTGVIANGKVVMSNRKILTVDEEEILKESRMQAERLWERMVNLPPV